MDSYFADFWDRLDALHQDAKNALDGLPFEALDWSPADDVPSLTVFATHLAGSERYWIGELAGNELANRNRAAEFDTKAMSAADLISRIDSVGEHSQQVLSRLTLHDLSRQCRHQPNDSPYTVAWALLHSLEHTAGHVGHMQMLRQWWDAQL